MNLNSLKLKKYLIKLSEKKISVEKCLKKIKFLPFEELKKRHCLDHHRFIRKGIPEVVYGEGKTPRDIIQISRSIIKKGIPLLVTRTDPEKARKVRKKIKIINYSNKARCLFWFNNTIYENINYRGYVSIVTAGSSDINVAEEAYLTLKLLGCPVKKFYDIGVAGLHRVINNIEKIANSKVVIVIAGMDGVLPTVLGGLLDIPIIAVPTSVGYGVNFTGIAPLLTMLNSCAPGISVVNIDNGFGAGVMAYYINKK